jgi:hypothetical protein
MTKYNYFNAVKEDIKNYMEENSSYYLDFSQFEDIEELRERLYEDLWTADSVTGNGSGSYTFNIWEAEENLCHNIELLGEALEEFGCKCDVLEKGAEWCDVTIRCYLLGSAISEVMEEIEDDFNEYKEQQEQEESEEE